VDEARGTASGGDDGFWDLFQEEEPTVNPRPKQELQEEPPAEVWIQEESVQAEPAMAASASGATGRLFRSYYVIDATATPALRPDQARKLRTVRSPIDQEAEREEPARRSAPKDDADGSRRSAGRGRRSRSNRQPTRSRRGLRGGIAYLVVIGTTMVVGALEALITGSGIGWWTGIALVCSTVYVALTLSPADAPVAVIAPPLAALIAAATVGQVGVQGGIIERGLAMFLGLGRNWPWILGAAVIGLVIVLVRSRREP